MSQLHGKDASDPTAAAATGGHARAETVSQDDPTAAEGRSSPAEAAESVGSSSTANVFGSTGAAGSTVVAAAVGGSGTTDAPGSADRGRANSGEVASPSGRSEELLPDEASASGVRSGNTVPAASVTAMFDRIAPVYDRLNTLMTLGQDGRWRRAAVEACGLRPGDRAIDVACGTGRLTMALAERVGPFGKVLGVDRSTAMIELAREAARDLVQVEFVVADALALPVEDGSFDAATIGFGLRNLPDFEAGFRELARVVRPGGRVVCLELTQPRPAIWAKTFRALFGRLAPLAGRLYGVGDAYRYLPESLEGFPDAAQMAAIMRRAGLVEIRVRRFGLATVALHVGRVPPRS